MLSVIWDSILMKTNHPFSNLHPISFEINIINVIKIVSIYSAKQIRVGI